MNKLLVVTGGTKGIGLALVHKFASEGFDVATCARSIQDLEQLAKEFKLAYPQNTLYTYQTDVSSKQEVHDFCNSVLKLQQPITILINNSGIYIPGQIHSEEEGALEKMIETNLYSAYHVTRALLPNLLSNKGGYIFNICSTASITPYTNGGSYCISKYALLGMTKVLREEMKPLGIKVTAVLPGPTKTASWDGVDLPDERFIKAEDIADSIYGVYKLSSNTVVEEILIRPQLGDIV